MSRKITKNTFSVILLGSLIWMTQAGYAQERGSYDYTREFIWGISKNTNSGLIAGLAGKFSRSIGDNRFQTFGLEIVNVKHPKELRRVSRVSGNTFLLGKTNYLFSVRPQYGREWVVFKKAPQQGVQVNAILAGGPTIGIVMPYYIQYAFNNSSVITVPYDPEEYPETSRIVGTGPFLRGIGESQIKVGANIKASLAFEFGTFKNDVTGFEAGFQLEAFPNVIELVPTANNRSLYPSAFIMLFYGGRK
uniref:Outer membrane protein beta-barrel domain-containing protein n=1 Tax=Roseihalotalea indica TaxID=2867963 RepID=A0AA49GLY2_9BACT|nr:hypothetical protein K4G66_25910 [Tunicatimonas sp. TK19036]